MTDLPELEPLRALLVDDDTMFCRGLAWDLGEYGLEVTAVDSADDALVAVTKHAPDVLIVASSLRDGAAMQVIDAVRKRCPAAIIALTNLFGAPTAIAAGCDACLNKPCSGEQLIELVDALLHPHDAAPAQRALPS